MCLLRSTVEPIPSCGHLLISRDTIKDTSRSYSDVTRATPFRLTFVMDAGAKPMLTHTISAVAEGDFRELGKSATPATSKDGIVISGDFDL